MGANLQYLLVWGLLRRSHLYAAVSCSERRPYRQCQQRQRLLGLARTGRAAHCLCSGQVCRQRVHRSTDYRPALECSSRKMFGGHARAYWYLDRVEHRPRVGRWRCDDDDRCNPRRRPRPYAQERRAGGGFTGRCATANAASTSIGLSR